MKDISATDFAKLSAGEKTDWLFLDVREEIEFYTFNIGGKNIPLGKLQAFIDEGALNCNSDQTILVICQRGIRSKTAKQILEQNGYTNVKNLIGGLVKLNQIQHL